MRKVKLAERPPLNRLGPVQLKAALLRHAKEPNTSKAATHKFLHAGRGNPNWIAATPREAFFLLGQFALIEARQTRDEGSLAGMPRAAGAAARLRAFLDGAPPSASAQLLRQSIDYGVSLLGFDGDAFVHELVDGVIGDNYPEPDRMLVHTERIVQRFLAKTMCDGKAPGGTCDLFAVEGGTAAMCYVFKSLVENHLLHRGDSIALGTPILTPYLELPRLASYGFQTVEIEQSGTGDGIHVWQYTEKEIAKLADPRIKAFFLVNPSNPASRVIDSATQRRIVDLVRTKRPDLIIVTDDVYGTFAGGFRSLAADLPHNTILVYSYSKHFGCTGWRLGVIAIHQDNVLDRALATLPRSAQAAAHQRYRTLSAAPDRIKFIDRLVADSRDVALNHTAGLSTPQQVQMALFSLFALLDRDDEYQTRCRTLVRERLAALGRGLGIEVPQDALRVAYYITLDLAVWGRKAFGDGFTAYAEAHHDPQDVVLALAKRSGTVLLNGTGFDGPPWSVRVSLANLDTDAYEAIGRDLKALMGEAVEEWQRSRR